MVMPSLSSVLFNCGLLACAQLACAAQFSGPTEVKKYLAENEYTLLACRSNCNSQSGDYYFANTRFSCCGKTD